MNEDQRYPTDPSELTTQMVWREVSSLKELLEARISAVEKGIQVAHDDLVRVPTETQKQVGNLKELLEQRIKDEAELRDEKFAGVQKQFDGSKTAVDAALAAVKESGNKTETGFTKQIDQFGALLQSNTKGLEAQIDDLKDRFNRGEGRGEGSASTMMTHRAANSYMIAVIGVIVAILGLGAGIIIAATRH